MARSCRSVTTFTTLGLSISSGSSMRFFSVRHGTSDRLSMRQHRRVDRGRIYQRFVSLDVYDHFGWPGGGNFGHAVRTGSMVGARHSYRRPKARAASAIRSSSVAMMTWDEISCRARTLENVLQHRLTGDDREGFTGEARRREPGWNNPQNSA